MLVETRKKGDVVTLKLTTAELKNFVLYSSAIFNK